MHVATSVPHSTPTQPCVHTSVQKQSLEQYELGQGQHHRQKLHASDLTERKRLTSWCVRLRLSVPSRARPAALRHLPFTRKLPDLFVRAWSCARACVYIYKYMLLMLRALIALLHSFLLLPSPPSLSTRAGLRVQSSCTTTARAGGCGTGSLAREVVLCVRQHSILPY